MAELTQALLETYEQMLGGGREARGEEAYPRDLRRRLCGGARRDGDRDAYGEERPAARHFMPWTLEVTSLVYPKNSVHPLRAMFAGSADHGGG